MINKFRYRKPQTQQAVNEAKDKNSVPEKNVCKDSKREEAVKDERKGVLDKEAKSKLKVSGFGFVIVLPSKNTINSLLNVITQYLAKFGNNHKSHLVKNSCIRLKSLCCYLYLNYLNFRFP